MRFKELRGLGLALMLLVLDLVLFYLGIRDHSRLKLAIAVLFFFIIFFNLMTQFYVRVLDDCLLIYRRYLIFLFPVIISRQDIQNVSYLSKHHVAIQINKRMDHLYVWNAMRLYQLLINRKEKE